MKVEFNEVMLECDVLCEQLGACQKKCHLLEQEVANQQKIVEEAFTRAIEVEKESLNSMEDLKCYQQNLIDTKEHY